MCLLIRYDLVWDPAEPLRLTSFAGLKQSMRDTEQGEGMIDEGSSILALIEKVLQDMLELTVNHSGMG